MKKKGLTDFRFNCYDEHHHYMGYEKYQALLVPLKRKCIYGERKIIPLDSNDEECNRVFYDENDMTLYPQKATGLCRLNKDGTIYTAEKNDIGKAEKKQNEDVIEEVVLSEMKESFAKYYINFEAEKVYSLQGYDTYAISALLGDRIFNEESVSGKRRIWIFQRKENVFLVCGKTKDEGPFAEKNMGYQIDDQPLLSDVSDLDDLDFEMY